MLYWVVERAQHDPTCSFCWTLNPTCWIMLDRVATSKTSMSNEHNIESNIVRFNVGSNVAFVFPLFKSRKQYNTERLMDTINRCIIRTKEISLLGRMNFRSVLLNEDTLGRFVILGSKLFHMVTQKGKKVL